MKIQLQLNVFSIFALENSSKLFKSAIEKLCSQRRSKSTSSILWRQVRSITTLFVSDQCVNRNKHTQRVLGCLRVRRLDPRVFNQDSLIANHLRSIEINEDLGVCKDDFKKRTSVPRSKIEVPNNQKTRVNRNATETMRKAEGDWNEETTKQSLDSQNAQGKSIRKRPGINTHTQNGCLHGYSIIGKTPNDGSRGFSRVRAKNQKCTLWQSIINTIEFKNQRCGQGEYGEFDGDNATANWEAQCE